MMTLRDRLTLTRRHVLAGTATVGAAVAAGTTLRTSVTADSSTTLAQDATPAAIEDGFVEPMQYASEDGHLTVTLQAMADETTTIARMGYNAMTPGPTLRIRQGDTVRVALVNAL